MDQSVRRMISQRMQLDDSGREVSPFRIPSSSPPSSALDGESQARHEPMKQEAVEIENKTNATKSEPQQTALEEAMAKSKDGLEASEENKTKAEEPPATQVSPEEEIFPATPSEKDRDVSPQILKRPSGATRGRGRGRGRGLKRPAKKSPDVAEVPEANGSEAEGGRAGLPVGDTVEVKKKQKKEDHAPEPKPTPRPKPLGGPRANDGPILEEKGSWKAGFCLSLSGACFNRQTAYVKKP